MNRTYRSIWNRALGTWVAAPETARHGGGSSMVTAPPSLSSIDEDRILTHTWSAVRKAGAVALLALPGLALAQSVTTSGAVNQRPSPNPSANWNVNGTLEVGSYGTGSLSILNGGTVSTSNSFTRIGIGALGKRADGRMTVDGSGSSFSGFNMNVGDTNSTGVVNVTNGGKLAIKQYIVLGDTIGSTLPASGTLTVDGAGSEVVTQDLMVGANGDGTLIAKNGAKVVVNYLTQIGMYAGGSGSATISGAGTTFDSAIIRIGSSGPGTLVVEDQAHVTAPTVELGMNKGSKGEIKLNSSGVLTTGWLAKRSGDGSVTFDGGVLQLSANQSNLFQGFALGDVQLLAGGGIIDTQNFSVVNGLGLEGVGRLTKAGSGTLVLTEANTYTGGTTIAEGTLQLGNGGTSGSIVGDVLDNGMLKVNRSDAFTLDGVISGSGALNQVGTSTTVLTGSNTYTGGTTIAAGTLQLGNGGTIGSIVGDVTNNGSLAVNRADTFKLDGAISGTGSFKQMGAGATVLAGANSYTGVTDVLQGTLAAGAHNAFSRNSAHDVAAGAMLDLAGYDQTLSSLSNSGTVRLHGNTPGTVLKVTGPYVGNDGTLQVGTVLGTDDSASDKVLLSGSTGIASGHTSVQVTNVGGLGALTTGNGIAVIETENGASLQPGSFTLAGEHVDAGAYEYRLYQTAQGASLKSTITPPPLPPQPPAPEPSPTPEPSPEPEPVVAYRPEVPLLSALPAQLRQADLAMLGDWHKRMGDDSAQSATGQGRRAWGRVLRTDPTIRQQGTVSPESRGHMTGFQAGLDLYADQNVRAGLYVGQLEGDMSTTGFASGVEHKYVGFNTLRSRYLGLYGTWQDASGLYVDAVLQGADYRSVLHTAEDCSEATTKGSGWLASLEVGKPYALNHQWQVEPQAQIIYRQMSLDDTALSSTTVQNQAANDWMLRLGARVKGSFATSVGHLQPYGRINFYKASNSTDVTRFITPAATTGISARTGYMATELAAGASLQLSPRTSIYGELGKLWSSGGDSRVNSGVQASIGVKVLW